MVFQKNRYNCTWHPIILATSGIVVYTPYLTIGLHDCGCVSFAFSFSSGCDGSIDWRRFCRDQPPHDRTIRNCDNAPRDDPALADGSAADTTTAAPAPSSPAKAATPTSKFAAFVSANKAESHIPTFGSVEGQEEGSDDGDGGGEGGPAGGLGRVCKVHGCDKRAVENVAVCPMHTKR